MRNTSSLPIYKKKPIIPSEENPIRKTSDNRNIASSKKHQNTRKVYIETYGCQMNVSDSELMSGILTQAGHKTVNDIDAADELLRAKADPNQHDLRGRTLAQIAAAKRYPAGSPLVQALIEAKADPQLEAPQP